jgi:hypothetical protein
MSGVVAELGEPVGAGVASPAGGGHDRTAQQRPQGPAGRCPLGLPGLPDQPVLAGLAVEVGDALVGELPAERCLHLVLLLS